MEQRPRPRPTSGFYGVSLKNKRWAATITYGGKCHRLGTFDTKEQAALAYDTAASAFTSAVSTPRSRQPSRTTLLRGSMHRTGKQTTRPLRQPRGQQLPIALARRLAWTRWDAYRAWLLSAEPKRGGRPG